MQSYHLTNVKIPRVIKLKVNLKIIGGVHFTLGHLVVGLEQDLNTSFSHNFVIQRFHNTKHTYSICYSLEPNTNAKHPYLSLPKNSNTTHFNLINKPICISLKINTAQIGTITWPQIHKSVHAIRSYILNIKLNYHNYIGLPYFIKIQSNINSSSNSLPYIQTYYNPNQTYMCIYIYIHAQSTKYTHVACPFIRSAYKPFKYALVLPISIHIEYIQSTQICPDMQPINLHVLYPFPTSFIT